MYAYLYFRAEENNVRLMLMIIMKKRNNCVNILDYNGNREQLEL